MTVDNLLTLAILAGALILFVSERLRVDVVALLVLLSLILSGLLTVEEAFTGFSSPAVVTVWAVFIISGALNRSGIADALGRTLIRLAGPNPLRLTVTIMLTVGFMSAFMNNIGAVAILLPAVVTVAANLKIPPSKLLIPLSFASLLGGNMTLIGTQPNILAAGILENYPGLSGFDFFDYTPMGVIVLATGVLYMALLGRYLLPARTPGSAISHTYQLRPFLTELRIREGSPLDGRSAAASTIGDRYNLNVIHVARDRDAPFFPGADRPLQVGDILLVEGRAGDIITASEALGLAPAPGVQVENLELELTSGTNRLVEVTLAPGSELVGKSIRQIRLRERYDLTVLALRHQGKSLITRLSDVKLRFGDSLLVQGEAEKIDLLRRDPNYLLLDTPPLQPRRLRKARLTIAILLGVLLAITMGWLHPSAAMLGGALLMIITGALSMDEAYQSIEWKSVFLIAGILPLGIAMDNTGTAALLAEQITGLLGGLGPRGVMVGIFVMTALLTEIISNAAATVLVVPIAIDTALGLGVSPHTFVMAVVIAASTSFLMPIGHQVNVIVFGPGGYQFFDYTRVGFWLNLIMLGVVTLFLPIFWPL